LRGVSSEVGSKTSTVWGQDRTSRSLGFGEIFKGILIFLE
jgi:hypothetical protein